MARTLDAVILRPYSPVFKFCRVVDEATGVQSDFMPVIHGVRSFVSLKSRAEGRNVGGFTVLVATLDDVVTSKKSADRDRGG